MTRCRFLFSLLALILGSSLAPLTTHAGISADPTGPVVTVETPQALRQAYLDLSAWADGGGTILLAPGFPRLGEIALSAGNGNPVHITSANPDDPVQITRIALDGVDNLRISHVHVDSTGHVRNEFMRDIEISRSARVEIRNSTFTSNGSILFDPNGSGVLGERLGLVRDSEAITMVGNYFARYGQGITFRESTDIVFSGNELTLMQGDGLRLTGVRNVMVARNYFHDFAATPNEFTHSDFIQMWSGNAITESRNVTVTGNILDTGNGVSVQPIFMRNEQNDLGNPDHVYENITITENLIYSGSANGIGVGVANNVLVANNTLLWNQSAVTIKADGDTSFFPRIRLDETIRNGRILNNIATRILHGPDTVLEGNVLISWREGDANYAGYHFVNVAEGGDIGPSGGWQLLEDSAFVGTGAPASQPGASLPVPRR